MYLGPPYHAGYQYQSNPQRYGPQNITNPQGQYIPANQTQNQTPQNVSYGPGYNTKAQKNLPPYSEYQEYKKR